jgi:hypothetical protein
MSKPGKVLKGLCKKLGVRLTVKRGQKRVYKSVAVLKRQCANKKKVKKKKVKRRRRRKFGTSSRVKLPTTAVISLDYDGCSDIIFEENWITIAENVGHALKNVKDFFYSNQQSLLRWIKKIIDSHDKIIIMCGSNRQSGNIDNILATHKGTGEAFVNLEKLTKSLREIYGDKVSLDKILIADLENNKDGEYMIAWDQYKLTAPNYYIKGTKENINDRLRGKKGSDLKDKIIYEQVKHSEKSIKEGILNYYFIDDKHDYFKHFNKNSAQKWKKEINNENLYTTIQLLKFDWYERILKKEENLAIGGEKEDITLIREPLDNWIKKQMNKAASKFQALFRGNKIRNRLREQRRKEEVRRKNDLLKKLGGLGALGVLGGGAYLGSKYLKKKRRKVKKKKKSKK